MSPRFFIGILVVIALLGVSYFFVAQDSPQLPRETPTTTPSAPVSPQLQTFSSAKYGISFSYPDTYQLTEIDAPGSAMREHHVVMLMKKEDLPAPEGGEGPPAITIEMFQNNLDRETTEGWIRNSSNSNFKLSQEQRLASTTVSGEPALSYRWSGLYEGTTIAQATPSWVYAYSVTYLEPGADIVQDFVRIRDSIQLNATSGVE